MASAHWYRRRWDGPNGDERERGPGNLYLEASLDGTCLRQVGTTTTGSSATTAGVISAPAGAVTRVGVTCQRVFAP